MSDNLDFDPHKHQTIYHPPAQTDIFTIIKNNTGGLAWIATGLAAFVGLILAWERKASKVELEKAKSRVLLLEKEIVRIRTELKYRFKTERRRP